MSLLTAEVSLKLVVVETLKWWRWITACYFAWQYDLELYSNKCCSLESGDQLEINMIEIRRKIILDMSKSFCFFRAQLKDQILHISLSYESNRRIFLDAVWSIPFILQELRPKEIVTSPRSQIINLELRPVTYIQRIIFLNWTPQI